MVPFLAWLTTEIAVIWLQRPPVVYDPWTGHWRAQRRMEKPKQTYRMVYPPTPPEKVTKVPRLRVVDDLAS